jgi:hypothetical protein
MVPCIAFTRIDRAMPENIPWLRKRSRPGIKSLPIESRKKWARRSALGRLADKMLLADAVSYSRAERAIHGNKFS